jgi:hypothetical protein
MRMPRARLHEIPREEARGRAVAAAIVAWIALVGSGCLSDGDDDATRFGYEYEVATQGSGSMMPVLRDDTLELSVAYGGCNFPHAFALRTHRASANCLEVWLYKVTPDEPCLVLYRASVEFRLPGSVARTPRVILLAPDGETYVLRDGR